MIILLEYLSIILKELKSHFGPFQVPTCEIWDQLVDLVMKQHEHAPKYSMHFERNLIQNKAYHGCQLYYYLLEYKEYQIDFFFHMDRINCQLANDWACFVEHKL